MLISLVWTQFQIAFENLCLGDGRLTGVILSEMPARWAGIAVDVTQNCHRGGGGLAG